MEELLKRSGYSSAYIQMILSNPSVRKKIGDNFINIPLWKLIEQESPKAPLKTIQKYYPPLYEDQPEKAPSVPMSEFFELQEAYKRGDLSVENNRRSGKISFPQTSVKNFQTIISEQEDVIFAEGLQMISDGKVASIIPGGGTSGRFFGYDTHLPESRKVKMFANMWELYGVKINPFELKLMYYAYLRELSKGKGIHVEVMGSGNNINYVKKVFGEYENLYSSNLVHFFAQHEIPRVNPTPEDILAAITGKEKKFKPPVSGDILKSINIWMEQNGLSGEIFRNDDGTYTGKPPGPFDIIAQFVISGRLLDLARQDVEIVHTGNSDDVGAIVDPRKAFYLSKQDVDMLCIMIPVPEGKKFWINLDGKDRILEDFAFPEAYPLNNLKHFKISSFYIKIEALLKLFDIGKEEIYSITLESIYEKVLKITQRLRPHIEIKPIKTGNEKGNLRPAAQFIRSVGEITALLNAQAIEVDINDIKGMNGYFSIKEPKDAKEVERKIFDFYGLNPGQRRYIAFPKDYFLRRKISQTLVGTTKGNLYSKVRNIFKYFHAYLHSNTDGLEITESKPTFFVSQETLNIMGLLAYKSCTIDEIKSWIFLFLNIQEIRESWYKHNIAPIWQFLIKNEQYIDYSVFDKSLIDELKELRKGSVPMPDITFLLASLEDYSAEDMIEIYPYHLPPSNQPPSIECLLLLKPPTSTYIPLIREVFGRISAFGYKVSGIRIFCGTYFKKNPNLMQVFYGEAYQGYIDVNISLEVLEKIREIYQNDFEFFFDIPFSEDLIVPASQLHTKWRIPESKITQLWKVGRPDISFENLKERFQIENIIVRDDGIHLHKKGRTWIIPLNLLGTDRKSIIWFRQNLPFGLNKVGPSRNIFPIKHSKVNNGRPTLIVNGYVPGLLNLFMEDPKTKTIAVVLQNANSKSASWKQLRDFLSGNDDNPRGNNPPGSIRMDAALGELPLNIDFSDKTALNAQKNVVHLSSGPLGAAYEIYKLFSLNSLTETSFGNQLSNVLGFSEAAIQVLIQKGKNNEAIKLTILKDPMDALKIIKRTYKQHKLDF